MPDRENQLKLELLYDDAQALCHRLVVLPRTARIEALLLRAEARRERRRIKIVEDVKSENNQEDK